MPYVSGCLWNLLYLAHNQQFLGEQQHLSIFCAKEIPEYHLLNHQVHPYNLRALFLRLASYCSFKLLCASHFKFRIHMSVLKHYTKSFSKTQKRGYSLAVAPFQIPLTPYSTHAPWSYSAGAWSSNRVYSFMKVSFAPPVGPFLCLATIISAPFLKPQVHSSAGHSHFLYAPSL